MVIQNTTKELSECNIMVPALFEPIRRTSSSPDLPSIHILLVKDLLQLRYRVQWMRTVRAAGDGSALTRYSMYNVLLLLACPFQNLKEPT